MSETPLLARLRDGRELPVHTCNCGHCGNEWFMAGLSEEWMPNFCPYCGIKFVRKTTDEEADEYTPHDMESQLIDERDQAQDAADRMASLVLDEPIDWAFHDDAWRRAIEQLEST